MNGAPAPYGRPWRTISPPAVGDPTTCKNVASFTLGIFIANELAARQSRDKD